MVKIESYFGENDKEIIEFLSLDNFMASSMSPSESVIASVLDYQHNTNNYNRAFGTVMRNEKEEVVGFLGTLSFPVTFENRKLTVVQTSSAFVNKNYPGNFGKILKHYVDANADVPTFTIFPVPQIFSSFEKFGFVEVNKDRFKRNYYIVTDYVSFFDEFLQRKALLRILVKPMSFFINILFRQGKTKSDYLVERMNNFNNDYSLIENDYKTRMAGFCAASWNSQILSNKFANKLSSNQHNLKENEVIHLCTFNNAKEIVGSIVLKKIRDYKRLIVSDVQTINSDRESLVNSLIGAVCKELKQLNYNSLMFFGLEECYSEIILRNFKHIKKSIDKRVYFKPFSNIPESKISIVFADDDLNF